MRQPLLSTHALISMATSSIRKLIASVLAVSLLTSCSAMATNMTGVPQARAEVRYAQVGQIKVAPLRVV